MNIGEKIKTLRERCGLTLQEVGAPFGISRSSVAGWESGDSKPGIDKLPALARMFNVSVDELLSDRPLQDSKLTEEDRRKAKRRWDDIVDANVESANTAGMLPLISDVQAGNWSEIVDNFQPGDAEDWIPCPFKHGPNAFILRVAGQSMFNPGGDKSYAPGDFIAVDPQVEAMNRRMVVAKIDHEERATFKQLIVEPDGTHLLQALNPAWPNRIMPMPPGSRIVGVVIGKWTPE
jgi:SOS-response transcriptional repressor LexA